MKLGSLFDGSGGFPLAGTMCGITPAWASEIEPYPIAVTKARFPNMKHLGDITKIDGAKIEPVDVVTFGSPCQDLSVAGKQKGLAGERSGLFLEAIRIIKEMRTATNGKYPTFIIWENVPGAFSSAGGNDFRTVLEKIAQIADSEYVIPRPPNGWTGAGAVMGREFSAAWRTLDAQYWGVPQRRRRIYLVADFGGRRAGKILFERDGLHGDIAQGEEAREEAAGDFGRSITAAGFQWYKSANAGIAYMEEASPCIEANMPNGVLCAGFKGGQGTGEIGWQEECAATLGANMSHNEPTICIATQQGGAEIANDLCPTITAAAGMSGNNQPCICIAGNTIDRKIQSGGNGIGAQEDISYTLNTADRHAVCFGFQAFGKYKQTEIGKSILASDDITTGDFIVDVRNLREKKGISGTLQAKENGGYSLNYVNPVRTGNMVRRLTPLECCRLQGFPDWWMDGINGSDSAKYKMWGNGIALPCALYVMEGIAEYGRR